MGNELAIGAVRDMFPVVKDLYSNIDSMKFAGTKKIVVYLWNSMIGNSIRVLRLHSNFILLSGLR
jgi:hypothetical protein